MNRDDFKQAFSPLHASEEVLLEVTERMKTEKKPTHHGVRTGLVASLAAVLMLSVSVAFGSEIAAFFTSRLDPVSVEAAEAVLSSFSGDISTDAPYMTDAFGNPMPVPEMEDIAMGDAAVAPLVDGYLYDVEATPIVYEDYIFTVEQFIIDDKGMGMLSYTIENPNGVEYLEHGYGQVSVPLSPYLTTGAPFMDGDHADCYDYLLESSSTETKLHLVMFFGTFSEYHGEDLYFCITTDDPETEKVVPVGAVQLSPEKLVPSAVYTDNDGNTVALSPMGISIDWQQDYELLTEELLLTHNDGTYTVKSEERNIYNARVGYWITADNDDGYLLSSNYLFNCLVDVEAITEISLMGHCRVDGAAEHTELQRVYLP